MPKYHIDEVYPKGSTYPLIITFQNGYTTDNFGSKDCYLFNNEVSDKKFVATELDDLLYAGEEQTEHLGKTLIMARNKKTGKVRIIEVGSAELKPIIKIDNDSSQLKDTSNLELSRKFGSKKQKQRMEHHEKLKVNVQTVTEQMQSVTENISEDKLDLSSYNKTDSDDFYLPPIDRTADKLEDVYDISKILTEDEFEKIYSELEGNDYTSDMQPFIKSIVSTKNMSPRHTVLAVYASSLLKLYILMAKDITKKSFAACGHSPTLNEIILSNFMTMSNGRRTRPTPYKDKALCHAIVFILLINNLTFEIDGLCQDMKLTPNNASTKVRVTGASVMASGSKKVVKLKMPLSFKTPYRRKSAKF